MLNISIFLKYIIVLVLNSWKYASSKSKADPRNYAARRTMNSTDWSCSSRGTIGNQKILGGKSLASPLWRAHAHTVWVYVCVYVCVGVYVASSNLLSNLCTPSPLLPSKSELHASPINQMSFDVFTQMFAASWVVQRVLTIDFVDLPERWF